MADRSRNLKKIEKEIRKRTDETPYREGVYVMKHPLFMLVRPKLTLKYNKKQTRLNGSIALWGNARKMKLVEVYNHHLVYEFNIDIFPIDMVIHFYTRYGFEGFFDTPLGHIRFTGTYLKGIYGE